MSDYSQGKIYKIISSECDLVYYGSTVQPLNKRFSIHKSKFKRLTNGLTKQYCSSFKIIEKGNSEIVLVENYPCQNKIELELREAEYIKNNDCVNKIIPCRTIKEWREANREKILEQNKEYYQENKEQL